MSKFYQALEKAEQERTRRRQDTVRGQDQSTTPLTNGLGVPPLPASESNYDTRPSILESPLPSSDDIETHLVSITAPDTFEAEQYRTLSYKIEQLHTEASLSVIAVSSPAMGDGKTTTAINLATALTQIPGARVLLADFDIRRPSVPTSLGLTQVRGRGTVDFVQDHSLTFDAVLQKYPLSKLTLLLAGRVPPTPHEVLKSPRLEELIADLRPHYDYIVIDTPPLVPFPDCRLIERLVDGFLVVVAAHVTPRKLVTEALNMLNPDKIVGVVFNRDDHSTVQDYAYYTYRTYGQTDLRDGMFGRLIKGVSGLFRGAVKG